MKITSYSKANLLNLSASKISSYDALISYLDSEVDAPWEQAQIVERSLKDGIITDAQYESIHSKYPSLLNDDGEE
jgi:hypothetical protein